LRPINKLTIYGRNLANATLLKNKIANVIPTIQINISPTIEKAVKNSEIIITTTSSTTPIVKSEWLSYGQHITAMGADDTFKKELETECFENANRIFIDSVELNKKYGEYKDVFAKNPSITDKTFEFGQFFSNNKQRNHQELTIAKLVGLGVQDLATATVVINKYNGNKSV
jgi:ornithine cyclodeaminase